MGNIIGHKRFKSICYLSYAHQLIITIFNSSNKLFNSSNKQYAQRNLANHYIESFIFLFSQDDTHFYLSLQVKLRTPLPKHLYLLFLNDVKRMRSNGLHISTSQALQKALGKSNIQHKSYLSLEFSISFLDQILQGVKCMRIFVCQLHGESANYMLQLSITCTIKKKKKLPFFL